MAKCVDLKSYHEKLQNTHKKVGQAACHFVDNVAIKLFSYGA